MCGIISVLTKNKENQNIKNILIDGLKLMEYRGYDSCGISVIENKQIKTKKSVGRVKKLEHLGFNISNSNIGIAHTRWATHGKVTAKNAHPHVSSNNDFAIVHNGIITNYEQLKLKYLNNVNFNSQTDSEVIVQLIAKFVDEGENVNNALIKTTNLLKGSFALALICNKYDYILIAKSKSPLLIGLNDNLKIACSDMNVIAKYAKTYIELNDNDILKITQDNIEIISGENKLKENEINSSEFIISKEGYDHFMLKEIYEQPKVISNLIKNYLDSDNLNLNNVVNKLKEVRKIYIIASGTSYHSGLIAKDYFEKFSNISTEVFIASEFAYNLPLIAKNSAFIFISQSGETADLISCINEINDIAKYKLVITNSKLSTMARICDDVLELFAGPEIAVASTKAYIAQVTLLAILSNKIKNVNIKKDLVIVKNQINTMLNQNNIENIQKIVKKYLLTSTKAFYLGRLYDYYVSLEAALKLKEISYINASGYAGGELKHGPISLIEKNTPVIGIVCSNSKINAHMYSNLKEVESRGANVITISNDKTSLENNIYIGEVPIYISCLVSVIPTQLIAYYSALYLNCNVDKPRNLAKSVTVE